MTHLTRRERHLGFGSAQMPLQVCKMILPSLKRGTPVKKNMIGKIAFGGKIIEEEGHFGHINNLDEDGDGLHELFLNV